MPKIVNNTLLRALAAADTWFARQQPGWEPPVGYDMDLGVYVITDPDEVRECCERLSTYWLRQPGNLPYHLRSIRHCATLHGASYNDTRYEIHRRTQKGQR